MNKLKKYQAAFKLLTDERMESENPFSDSEISSIADLVAAESFTKDELTGLKARFPKAFSKALLKVATFAYRGRPPRLVAHFDPGFSGEILVHAADNGVVLPSDDSGGRHATNVIKNVLLFGPFGLLSAKNRVIICTKCETEFARNIHDHVLEKAIAQLVASGELVRRHHSVASIAFDPSATQA